MTGHRGVKISRNPRVVYRDLSEDEGAVLLHLDTGAYHGVNAVGGAIWGFLEADIEFDDLLARLRELLVGAPATLDEEVWGFLEELNKRDLVTIERVPFTGNERAPDSSPDRGVARHPSRRPPPKRARPSSPDSEVAL